MTTIQRLIFWRKILKCELLFKNLGKIKIKTPIKYITDTISMLKKFTYNFYLKKLFPSSNCFNF